MRIPASCVVTVATLAVLAACGGEDSPLPTPPVQATSIELTSAASGPLVSLGDTRTITAEVRDGNSVINAPTVAYSSGNQSVATVSGSGTTATITATGNGTTIITATSGTVTATYEITVAQRLNSISLSVTPLLMGATEDIAPIARDARNNPISGVTGFTFTSSAPSVAFINDDGLVTAIAPGQATIGASATLDGVSVSESANLTVTSPVAGSPTASVTATASSTFNPPTVTVQSGGTVNFTFESIDHTVTFQTAGAPASIPASSNTTVERTFPTAGSFAYICTIHTGMAGTVNVAGTGFFAAMSGAAERPNPTSSTATGAASFTRSGDEVSYIITWQGLTGAPTALHIHGPASSEQSADAIVPIDVGAQPGTVGVLTGTFSAAAIQGVNGQPPMSLDALMTLLQNGNAYVNLHTAQFPDGEIRGQLGPP